MTEPVVVRDACALIAYFNDEEGAGKVEWLLSSGSEILISAVNVLEIAYDAVKVTGKPEAANDVLAAVDALPCSIIWDLNPLLLGLAAKFKAQNKISLADAIALALAAQNDAPLVTSDRHEFTPVEEGGTSRFIWIR